MSTPRRIDGSEAAQQALRQDFAKWESELPSTKRARLVPKWFRRRVSGPVTKWCHVVGHAALGPERFL